MADAEMTFDPIKKAYDEGYAAGWAAYGDLMIEQLGPDGMVWRPIGTAPRDWSNVHVFDPEHEDGNDGGVLKAWFDAEDEVWRTNDFFGMAEEINPTLWMPLPKPPMTSARKEAA